MKSSWQPILPIEWDQKIAHFWADLPSEQRV